MLKFITKLLIYNIKVTYCYVIRHLIYIIILSKIYNQQITKIIIIIIIINGISETTRTHINNI